VTGISANWSNVWYSVCLGGTYDTFGYGIALDSSTNVFITGTTLSTNYPTLNAGVFSFNGADVINGTNSINGIDFTGTNDVFLTEISFGSTVPTVSQVEPTNQIVGYGATVNFSVTVGGATEQLFYQWQTNGTNIVNGGRISGATNSILTITNAQPSDSNTNYGVIVYYPGGSITNSGANLTVLITPYVAASSPTNVIVPVGTNVTFSVTPSGSPVYYVWGFDNTLLSTNSQISNVTNNTLTVNDLQTNDSGVYTAVLYNQNYNENQNTLYDYNFTLTVVDPNFSIVTAPTNQTVSTNTTVSFTVVTTGFPLTYQWSTNGVPLTDGANISGANGSTLTISNVQASDAGTYTVSITNAVEYPDFTVSTNLSAVLTVDTDPTFSSFASPRSSTNGLVLTGAGGKTNGTYYVLTSSNLMTWTPMATNQFNSMGQFIFTNPAPTNSAQFFKLEQP